MIQQPQQQITAGEATEQSQDPMESSGEASTEAPPKQVALAMERLASAARKIADIRLGADRLLEAIFLATGGPQQSSNKTVQFILREETSMRQHFKDLSRLGSQLETSGVLNGATKLRSNSWGLHMPLICPDGAVVAYAWKRQLAGQAGASAVDRTRLALKAFTDQKRRFFPHLEDELSGDGDLGIASKRLNSQGSVRNRREDFRENKSLSDVLRSLEHEFSNVRIFTYQRLDWSKRASSLSSENTMDPFKDQIVNHPSNSSSGAVNVAAADKAAVIELLVPFVFRAVVSLHPAGSINPDAVAFFAADEGGNNIHARGMSVHHVFRHVNNWICCHHTLFSKACSKCGRLLMIDKTLALLLPPVHHAYWETTVTNSSWTELAQIMANQPVSAYHIGCSAGNAREN